MEPISYVLAAMLPIVSILVWMSAKRVYASQANSILKMAEIERDKTVKRAEEEAEAVQKEKLLRAKEKFFTLKAEHSAEINQREQEIKTKETEIDRIQTKIQEKERKVSDKLGLIKQRNKRIEQKEKEVEALYEEQAEKLESYTGMTIEDAKQELKKTLIGKAKEEAMTITQQIIEDAKFKADDQARKVIIQSMQRLGIEPSIDNSISVVHISDDAKGRIIGREGRNIRAFENKAGVDIIVDDTPDAVMISCIDPQRREIARLALQKLIEDGRIHPAKIEEVLSKTKKILTQQVLELGKRTVIDLNLGNLHPYLMERVGWMKFRSSYGQNLLHHSREVARLCGIMAAELNLDPKLAKRAGLLHDIGKVIQDDDEMPHALLGMKYAEKHGEHPHVCNAIGAHHDEIEMDNMLSPIIQLCDAISGSRPGARKQNVENYTKRIKEMEEIALRHNGVISAYALQAGRELRVCVESENISDQQAKELAQQISEEIQSTLTYPGQIKILVVRETRAVGYAK